MQAMVVPLVRSDCWVDYPDRWAGSGGAYDVRADFATHYLVCGDHDEYVVRRWSLGCWRCNWWWFRQALQLGKRGFAKGAESDRGSMAPPPSTRPCVAACERPQDFGTISRASKTTCRTTMSLIRQTRENRNPQKSTLSLGLSYRQNYKSE